jgi:hypothetical protein
MPDRRLYAQFTLDYADSHKIAPLSDGAFRAHVSMVLWSRRMMTDGRIPAAMAAVLARKPRFLAELVSNDPVHPSLVRDEHGDFWLHDFLEHQSSRAAIEARQEVNRANGAKGGQAKAKRTATEPVADSVSESVADFYTETEAETNPLLASLEGGAPPVDNPGEEFAPPARCAAHVGLARPPRCGACKDARLEHEAWQQAHPAAPAQLPARKSAWDVSTHCQHGQILGSCETCVYEASKAEVVIVGPWERSGCDVDAARSPATI